MKTAICGLWHVHAPDYFKKAVAISEVVGIYDEDEEKRKNFCVQNGVKEFSSFDELLESDADGVIVCTSTDTHIDYMLRIADAKKSIFTEKVLALSDEDCLKIEEAVKRNGVDLVISLLQKYRPGPLTVKKVCDSGELGKINYVRFRNCHSGSIAHWLPPHFYNRKQCGGGAMIDLGAHGMYLIDWLLGAPEKYSSAFTIACEDEQAVKINPDKVEDNAVTVMSYKNGCIAVNETGFVSNCYPMTLEVCGENGFVRYSGNEVVKCTLATGGKTESVPMCKELPLPIEQFLTGKILPGCGIDEAKALTHMMVGAYGKI